MNRFVLGAAALCLGASLAAAGEIVLPGDGFSPGWKRDGKMSIFLRADLFNHIDGGADLFLEFGFEKVIVQRYTRGKTEVAAEIYEMTGPDAALGIYLMKCGRESAFADIPARNSSETAQLTILKGRYFIQVDNFDGDEGAVPGMKTLSQILLQQIGDERSDSRLAALLPADARISGSERLIRGPVGLQPYFTFGEGDIFRQGGRIFGALAEYTDAEGRKFSMYSVEYPEAGISGEVFRGLRENLDPYLKVVESGETAFVFRDFKNRFGIVRASGTRIESRFNLAARPAL